MTEQDAPDAEGATERTEDDAEADAGTGAEGDADAGTGAGTDGRAGAEAADDADAAGDAGEAAGGSGADETAETAGEGVDLREALATAVDEAALDAEGFDEDGAEPSDDAVEGAVDDALVDSVAAADPAAVARELVALRVRAEGLEDRLEAREAELDDVTSQLKRKQADFQNYKKRMEERREQEKQRATEDLVERLLDVRDNLDRALDQDEADVAAVRDGVESTLRQFDRVLDDENVEVVEPEPGDDVDPHTHEVLLRVESDQPADAIAEVHRPGYVMADKVLRPAQVTVSEGSAGEAADDEEAGDDTGEGDADAQSGDGDGAAESDTGDGGADAGDVGDDEGGADAAE